MEKFRGATAFSRLLRAVSATGIERIKITTSFTRDFHTDIVQAIDENENLCNWVHLPVQSGSDKILKAMRRGHTAENYLRRVEVIKNSPRGISLTTDIIVGFPGETEKDFQATIDLVNYCQYDGAYIFKYSPRPGTPAAEITDDVSSEEKTRRFIELEKQQKSNQLKVSAGLHGKILKVLVESRSSRDDEELTGHSTCHKVVNFKGSENLLGEIVQIQVTESKINSLYGKVL
jgi:tRNA-2-methylthio-N6-dimethylallyladenosine synthase